MNRRYSEDEVIASVPRLTRARLTSFIELHIVVPIQTESGPAFRPLDLTRMELLCELTEEFELQGEALGVVISLIDQLHGVRAELRAVLESLARERPEISERVVAAAGLARSARDP